MKGKKRLGVLKFGEKRSRSKKETFPFKKKKRKKEKKENLGPF